MSAYLKRLQIDSVEESAEHPSAYLKRVEVVEVVDQDGNPWEPVPGPDPWDDLVVVTPTSYDANNDYTVGEFITGNTATYIGGTDQVAYRYRWQRRDSSDGSVTNSAWTNITNEVTAVTFEIVHGGQVRLQSQARDTGVDPVDQVNSFGNWKDISYPTLVVNSTTVSGEPYVGETITCAEPVVTGGLAPYTFSYMWLDSNAVRSSSNSTEIGSYDLGKVMNCFVTVTSADGQQGTTQTTNGLGPIQQYTIGDLVLTNDSTNSTVENNDIEPIMQGASVTYMADYTGNLPQDHAVWDWKVRGGNVTIRGSANLPYVVFELPNEYPGGANFSVSIRGKANENMTDEQPTTLWSIIYTE